MLRWLHKNPLGIALGSICGLLLLVFLLLALISSLPLSPVADEQASSELGVELELPTLAENQPLDNYSEITERPLFNESRLPILEDVVVEEEAPPGPDPDGEAPEVELAGVVITPSLRMVTLKRKDNALSLVAFEGKPIEADFGTWQVSSIQPRAATLRSAGGGELKLEMKVHDATIEPPVQAAPVDSDSSKGKVAVAKDAVTEPLSRAEEIRQRIAERREELRRESESGEQAEDSPQQPSYQQAIRSMIGRNRQKNPEDQNEQ